MELENSKRGDQTGSLTMAAISRVYTTSHVAKMLGEDEDWLQDLSKTHPARARTFLP
jgi:hypothetical protein